MFKSIAELQIGFLFKTLVYGFASAALQGPRLGRLWGLTVLEAGSANQGAGRLGSSEQDQTCLRLVDGW